MKTETLVFVSRVILTMATQVAYLRMVCLSAGAREAVLQELARLQVTMTESADALEQIAEKGPGQ